MTTFLLTFVIVSLAMLGLGVGSLFGRARLTRSCGGSGPCPCDDTTPSCPAKQAAAVLEPPLAVISSRPESGS